MTVKIVKVRSQKNGTTENVPRKSRRAHWLTLKGKLPTTIKINVTN